MPKIVDHEKYRKELADKCMDLFSRKGYANVTMREIAKELGVSTGLLYHYFPTKEAIFAHMAEHMSQSDVASVLEQVSDLSGVEDKLEVYGKHWTDSKGYYQSILLLAIDFLRNYGGSDKDRIKKAYIQYYVDAMAENLRIPEPLSRFIYVHMIGLMYHDLMLGDSGSFREQLELFLDMFVAHVKKTKPAASRDKPRSGSNVKA